jgi:hypothetical protein
MQSRRGGFGDVPGAGPLPAIHRADPLGWLWGRRVCGQEVAPAQPSANAKEHERDAKDETHGRREVGGSRAACSFLHGLGETASRAAGEASNRRRGLLATKATTVPQGARQAWQLRSTRRNTPIFTRRRGGRIILSGRLSRIVHMWHFEALPNGNTPLAKRLGRSAMGPNCRSTWAEASPYIRPPVAVSPLAGRQSLPGPRVRSGEHGLRYARYRPQAGNFPTLRVKNTLASRRQ